MCGSTFKVFSRQPLAQGVLGWDEWVAAREDGYSYSIAFSHRLEGGSLAKVVKVC